MRLGLLILAACLASLGHAAAEPLPTADGYHGIWYSNQPTSDEHRYKYSGGLGTYPQQHAPIAVYSQAANKTFFCYGGATGRPKELAAMVSYFDHATGKVPRPRIVLVKPTDDAHENPTLQLDEAGHVWIFSNTHGPAGNSYIFRSRRPYAIDDFEQIARTNFSYSQPHALLGEGWLFLHTRYRGGRRLLHWMTSRDGRDWSQPQPLAQIAEGHYQISGRHGWRVATAFNYHPRAGGLNARTNLYYLETADVGGSWKTADGKPVATPLTEVRNAALVHDYEAEGRLVYLKDLNFDGQGRPIILFLTSGGHAPGPRSGERQWSTAHWTGRQWQISPFATSDHNYDYGSLYVEEDRWQIIAATEPGPQPFATGGELVRWQSRNQGATWEKAGQLTHQSEFNHTYPRRPLNAHQEFYAIWADGNPHAPSSSRLYFTNRSGSAVWQLPTTMDGDEAAPLHAGDEDATRCCR